MPRCHYCGIQVEEEGDMCGKCLLEDHLQTGEPLTRDEVDRIVDDMGWRSDHDFVAVCGGLFVYDKSPY